MDSEFDVGDSIPVRRDEGSPGRVSLRRVVSSEGLNGDGGWVDPVQDGKERIDEVGVDDGESREEERVGSEIGGGRESQEGSGSAASRLEVQDEVSDETKFRSPVLDPSGDGLGSGCSRRGRMEEEGLDAFPASEGDDVVEEGKGD